MEESDRLFLVGLNNRLYAPKDSHQEQLAWSVTPHKLTEEEWTRVLDVISRERLMVELCNSSYGFRIMLVIYEHAPYPQTPPMVLVGIEQGMLPGKREKPDSDWEHAWQVFSALADAPHNRELLLFYGKPPLRERYHYVY